MILVNRLIELQKEYFVTVFDQAYNDNLSDAFEEEIVQKLEEKELSEHETKRNIDGYGEVNEYEE